MKNQIKKYSLIFSLVLVFVFIAGTFFIQLYVPVSQSKNSDTVRVEIPSGSSVKKIGQILKDSRLIRSKNFFYLASRFPFLMGRGYSYSLKSGVYNINRHMTMSEIFLLLDSGKQDFIVTVIPEGLTMSKIALTLEEEGVCKASDFMFSCTDSNLLKKYGIPALNFEGFLFPDTYFFTPSMSGEAVVSMMADNFFEHAGQIERFAGKEVTDYYSTVVLASIVEREYRAAKEAPLIASVFTNRIKENIGLYSCATIEYIITELLGRPHPEVITYDDLKIDSPYNTYKWAGLPPGPISNPGMVALEAAANPPVTDYYFFTLTDEAKGTHTFTKNFSSHTKAGSQFKTKKAASVK
jgi:UPF0755 protein